MKIERIWAMPNKNTFDIPPINQLIRCNVHGKSIDPFANRNKLAMITNDIDPQFNTDFHLDAFDFLKQFDDESIDCVLYDPPFSSRQVSESYKAMDKAVNMETTQSSFWSNLKKEIGRIVKIGGIVVGCGWNSGGIGKKYGYELMDVLLVPHGGQHNDTIVTVETKIQKLYQSDESLLG